MNKGLEVLKQALEDSRISERKHRIGMIYPTALILIMGVFLIIATQLLMTGIVTILISLALYRKIFLLSKDRTAEFENYVKIAEDE